MDHKLFNTLLGFTALIGGLYLLYVVLAPFLPAIGWAGVVAIATFPIYERLSRRLQKRANFSAGIMTAAVFLVIVIPAVAIIGLLVQELMRAERLVSEAVARGGFQGIDTVLEHPAVAPWVERFLNWVGAAQLDLKSAAVNAAKTVVSFLLGSLGAVIKNLFAFIFQLLLIVIALFFVYRDGARLENSFWSVLPMTDDTTAKVRRTTTNVVSAVVLGVLVTAAVQAALAALGYWFVGLPSVVLLGALTFISAFIPVVGTVLIWLPASAYLVLSGNIGYGIALFLWGAVVVGGIDSFLRPMLISGRTGLPLPLMMLGALGGLLAFGLFGLVIGPLALALLLVLYELVRTLREESTAVPDGAANDSVHD
jgi:predicted PurR-regulated permease PerM